MNTPIRIAIAAIIFWCMALAYTIPAAAATLLPPGEITFVDANGAPIAGGTVQFYVPSTTTPKDTWQDAGQSVLNTNPVVLDSAGRAIIYGSGSYRQIVKDQFGNLVWDQLTADSTSLGVIVTGGTSGGTANAQTVTAATWSGARTVCRQRAADNEPTGGTLAPAAGWYVPMLHPVHVVSPAAGA